MSCISLWAQGTVEDYNRAYALREKYNAKHVLYAGVVPHWVDQTSAFWYVRQTEKLPVKYFIGYVTLPIGREVLGLQHQK